MRREFGTSLAMALLALSVTLVSSPGVARAGITTDLKTGRPADRFQSQLTVLSVSFVAEGNSSGGSSSTDEDQTGYPRKPGHPGDPLTLLGDSEYGQIESGLITEEEALSGCGASVAGGRASLGALALVGLFLALRRRK